MPSSISWPAAGSFRNALFKVLNYRLKKERPEEFKRIELGTYSVLFSARTFGSAWEITSGTLIDFSKRGAVSLTEHYDIGIAIVCETFPSKILLG